MTVKMDATVLQTYNEVAVAEHGVHAEDHRRLGLHRRHPHPLLRLQQPQRGLGQREHRRREHLDGHGGSETTITAARPVASRSPSPSRSRSRPARARRPSCAPSTAGSQPLHQPAVTRGDAGSAHVQGGGQGRGEQHRCHPGDGDLHRLRLRALTAAVTAAKAKAEAAAKSLSKAKKAYKLAKQSGDAAKLKKASKKLKKAKAAAKAADHVARPGQGSRRSVRPLGPHRGDVALGTNGAVGSWPRTHRRVTLGESSAFSVRVVEATLHAARASEGNELHVAGQTTLGRRAPPCWWPPRWWWLRS